MSYTEACDLPGAPAWLRLDATSIPMIPIVAQRAIQMLADPDVSLSRLAQLVSREQVLASRLLAFANSAYCGAPKEVASISDAVLLVGAAGVRNTVIAACFGARLFDARVYGGQADQLMDHALGTAYLARLIGEQVGLQPDDAFLAGLLHDVGKLAILKAVFDHRRRGGDAVNPGDLAEAMARYHAEVGDLMLTRWGLPAVVRNPVRFHHAHRSAPAGRLAACVVYLADCLSHQYGFGCEPEAPADADPGWAECGVDRTWRDGLEPRARGLFQVARQTLLA